MAREVQIYFIRAATLGLIKIGRTGCAMTRLEALRTSGPDQLELMGIMLCERGGALEKELHARFMAGRAHGEWFRPTDDLLRFIAESARESKPKRRLSLLARRLRSQKRRVARRAAQQAVSA